jgi:DNA replication protein DnaC
LEPRPDLHPLQTQVIRHIKAHPDDSYLLTGRNGSGKSHIAWALYRHAVVKGRGLAACTVRDLLKDFRRMEVTRDSNAAFVPRVTPEQLKRVKGLRWFIFLDEFEKARPSEFASEMLFSLLDAAKSFGHQLVVTSNMPIEGLRQHWSRQNDIWGNSIIERLKGCYTAQMF